MSPSTYSALAAAAITIRDEFRSAANTANRVGSLLGTIIDTFYGSRFNVLAYGADPTGSSDPSSSFAAAAAAAALVNGTVYIPKGVYGNADWEWTVPSGVTVEGEGDGSVLYRCWLRVAGSFGNAIPFTGATVRGATSIPIAATGLTNKWLRVSSVINCQSPDAGVDQLGTVVSEASFFGEFARVLTGGGASATLDCRLVFPYSNTPGPDSGSFTTSIAREITFAEDVVLRRFKLLRPNSGHSEVMRFRFCRKLFVEKVTIDCDDQVAQGIACDYSLDCRFVDVTTIAKRTAVPLSSVTNGILFYSCQSCVGDRCTMLNGYQGVDITYIVSDATNRGGPCIGCGFINSTARDNERDGFTTHQGGYASFFETCTVFAKLGGIRIRSRGDRVHNCRVFGAQAANFGILIDDAAVVDSVVSENYVEGAAEGILFTHALTGLLPLETLLKCGSTLITHNTVRKTTDHGIYANTAQTSAINVGPKIVDNDIHFPAGNGIQIESYNNGTIVERNRISGIAASQFGIRWGANIKRLHIGTNWVYDVDAAGFAAGGNSTASMMTDLVTFPAGDAEAFLFVGEIFTDAATPFSSILRVPIAYTQPNTPAFGTTGTAARTGKVLRGSGSPEAVHYAPIGTFYQRTDGGAGTSLYVKESAGTSNTGWVAK